LRYVFFVHRSLPHLDLPSFPTRRSSDLRTLLLGMGAAPLVLRVQRRPARPKLAAICTTYFKYSHAQHIVDRFLEGYGWNGTHHQDRKSTRLKSSHVAISYAAFCFIKKKH